MRPLRFLSSYQRMRLLMSDHGPVVRGAMAAVAGAVALLATGRRGLARQSAVQAYTPGQGLTALRRCAWYARRSWLRSPLGRGDVGFDFTHGLSMTELNAVAQFVDRTAARAQTHILAGERAFIAARRLSIAPAMTAPKDGFYAAANALLATTPMPQGATFETPMPTAKSTLTRDDAALALADLAAIDALAAVPWFVVSGTFLGLVREDGFLAHDYDIDVGVMAEEIAIDPLVQGLKAARGFALRKIDVQHPLGDEFAAPRMMLIKLIHHTGVPIDVFFHYPTPDGRVVHGSSIHHWFNSPFDLTPYRLEGTDVRGPVDAGRYLTENYGSWRIPDADFDCSTDTSNLEIVRHPIALVMFLRRLVRSYRAQNPNALDLIDTLQAEGLIVRFSGDDACFEVNQGLF